MTLQNIPTDFSIRSLEDSDNDSNIQPGRLLVIPAKRPIRLIATPASAFNTAVQYTINVILLPRLSRYQGITDIQFNQPSRNSRGIQHAILDEYDYDDCSKTKLVLQQAFLQIRPLCTLQQLCAVIWSCGFRLNNKLPDHVLFHHTKSKYPEQIAATNHQYIESMVPEAAYMLMDQAAWLMDNKPYFSINSDYLTLFGSQQAPGEPTILEARALDCFGMAICRECGHKVIKAAFLELPIRMKVHPNYDPENTYSKIQKVGTIFGIKFTEEFETEIQEAIEVSLDPTSIRPQDKGVTYYFPLSFKCEKPHSWYTHKIQICEVPALEHHHCPCDCQILYLRVYKRRNLPFFPSQNQNQNQNNENHHPLYATNRICEELDRTRIRNLSPSDGIFYYHVTSTISAIIKVENPKAFYEEVEQMAHEHYHHTKNLQFRPGKWKKTINHILSFSPSFSEEPEVFPPTPEKAEMGDYLDYASYILLAPKLYPHQIAMFFGRGRIILRPEFHGLLLSKARRGPSFLACHEEGDEPEKVGVHAELGVNY